MSHENRYINDPPTPTEARRERYQFSLMRSLLPPLLSALVTGSIVYALTAGNAIADIRATQREQSVIITTEIRMRQDADTMTNNRLDHIATLMEKQIDQNTQLIAQNQQLMNLLKLK